MIFIKRLRLLRFFQHTVLVWHYDTKMRCFFPPRSTQMWSKWFAIPYYWLNALNPSTNVQITQNMFWRFPALEFGSHFVVFGHGAFPPEVRSNNDNSDNDNDFISQNKQVIYKILKVALPVTVSSRVTSFVIKLKNILNNNSIKLCIEHLLLFINW